MSQERKANASEELGSYQKLIDLYRQLPGNNSQPSAEVDARILALAQRPARATSPEQPSTLPMRRWRLPLQIAAAVATLGFTGLMWQQWQNDNPNRASMPMSDSDVVVTASAPVSPTAPSMQASEQSESELAGYTVPSVGESSTSGAEATQDSAPAPAASAPRVAAPKPQREADSNVVLQATPPPPPSAVPDSGSVERSRASSHSDLPASPATTSAVQAVSEAPVQEPELGLSMDALASAEAKAEPQAFPQSAEQPAPQESQPLTPPEMELAKRAETTELQEESRVAPVATASASAAHEQDDEGVRVTGTHINTNAEVMLAEVLRIEKEDPERLETALREYVQRFGLDELSADQKRRWKELLVRMEPPQR